MLALAHDHRVLKDGQGKAGAMVRRRPLCFIPSLTPIQMCLNEVDFGAKIPNVRLSLRVSTLIPQGMLSVIKSKVPASSFVPLGLGERFTGSRAVSLGLAHELATGGDQVVRVARERAAALAPKASAGVWGAIKVRPKPISDPRLILNPGRSLRRALAGDQPRRIARTHRR